MVGEGRVANNAVKNVSQIVTEAKCQPLKKKMQLTR